MTFREPRSSVDYARNFCTKIEEELNTYLPTCERLDVKQSLLASHFRMNTKVRAILVHLGYINWEDLYHVTVQELEETRVLNRVETLYLVKYAHFLSQLKPNDLNSDIKLEKMFNSNISNSDLIIYQSEIDSVHDFLQSQVYSWTEIEQKVFCRRFFANDQPNRLAREVGLPVAEVVTLYARLFGEIQKLSFFGDLIEILQNENYRIICRWRLMEDFPEFDIRPFSKFTNYRALDLVVTLIQIHQYGDSILDLSSGDIAKTISKQFSRTLVPINSCGEIHSVFGLIEPSLIEEYLSLLGFDRNHLYWASSSMVQKDILISYLKLRGRPANRYEFRSDLAGFLDSKSMNQKVIETHGVIIPITKDEYALQEWGFEIFLGAQEVISEYIKENGPTHIEMIFAILDGYGFSQKRVKEVASESPFALIDDVCFMMLDGAMD